MATQDDKATGSKASGATTTKKPRGKNAPADQRVAKAIVKLSLGDLNRLAASLRAADGATADHLAKVLANGGE